MAAKMECIHLCVPSTLHSDCHKRMTHAAVALCGQAEAPAPAVLLGPNVLPQELFSCLKADAGKIAKCPNYWFQRELIEAGECKTAAEEAIVHLYKSCLQGRLPDSWAGAEWWVQVNHGGRGLAFHFDKDEHAMKEAGQMVTPIFSSVLYLTGDPAAQRQSPTVIVNQRFDQEEGCIYPDIPDHSILVFPAANHYCLFDGGLGHGVLECSHSDVRATFLVNWWEQRPQAIHQVTDDDVSMRKLAPPQEGSSGWGGSLEHLTTCGAGAGKSGMERAGIVRIPQVSVSEEEVEVEGCPALDDLLQARGLSLSGKHAVGGVAISHPSLVLFPLDQEQLEAAEGQVQVGAILVSLAALEGSSEEEGCSEEEEEMAAGGQGNSAE